MKVQVDRQEGKKPYIHIEGNDVAYDAATIEEWIRLLRLAKAWLMRKQMK